ncbi:MAG: enoyl-CoA hydratase/isomerase family protein, partial [Candidatus Melainabacteria bacterium]|nr:enoyl-CoA hydratase/isomerase family protein [Candidatus Melainabacteria bacterium]
MPQTEKYWTGAPPDSFAFQRVVYSKTKYTATITINRPEILNCFDLLTLKEMAQAFQDASLDDAISVVVVTGAGDKAFCTG